MSTSGCISPGTRSMNVASSRTGGGVWPDCGHPRGWWPADRRLVEGGECHQQTSVTAGTVFHGARVPLWKWFWAIYQPAQDKKDVAALTPAKQIGVCYGTARRMLLKLRRAMRRGNERYVLQGLVEVDETYVGGEEPGRPGRPGRDSEIPSDRKPILHMMRSLAAELRAMR